MNPVIVPYVAAYVWPACSCKMDAAAASSYIRSCFPMRRYPVMIKFLETFFVVGLSVLCIILLLLSLLLEKICIIRERELEQERSDVASAQEVTGDVN